MPVNFLGLPLAPLTVAEFIHWIIEQSRTPGQRPKIACYLNAWTTVLAHDDPALAEVLRQSDCLYADGQSVVWAAGAPERVTAGDFIIDVLKQAAADNIRVGLLGGRPGVAERAAEAWRAVVPGLGPLPCWNGFELDSPVTGVDLLLVGMGSPRQELWAWEHGAATGARVIWCVGALFEYFGEGRPRAPRWMQRAGLEWLFRLIQEPRRMWRRYLVGNLRFIWLVLRAGGFRGRRG